MSDSSSTHQIVSEQILHAGSRFKFARIVERHPDGQEHIREVVRHPGAAVVLPILSDGQVILVEQHRTALGRTLLELPAGILESGEEPEAAAARELAEETGYRAGTMTPLVSFYPTPGLTDELMHVFVATELERGEQNLDAGEEIELRVLPQQAILDLMLRGDIVDGKTMLTMLYVMLVGIAANADEDAAS